MKRTILISLTILFLISTSLNIPAIPFFQPTQTPQTTLQTTLQTIQQHYHFNSPISQDDTIKPVTLLLPPSTTIHTITVNPSNPEPLPFDIIIPQSTRTRAFSHNQSLSTPVTSFHTPPTIQYFRGYPILTLNLHPTQHEPITNTFQFYKDITITIQLQPTTQHPLYRNGLDHQSILSKISNPEALSTYPPIAQSSFYDYLIITTEALSDTPSPNLSDLIHQRESQGLSCILKTTESIQSEYPGIDAPEKIRNFIKHAYTNLGITYVLLAGDIDKVPIRYLYDIDGTESTRQISSDLYYQCLDGNYNSDNDHHWGEQFDGPDNTQIDLYAEVYIGRAPVDDALDISSFVEKTLSYENSNWQTQPYTRKYLSVGEKVWDGVGGWGSEYAERCIDNCTDYDQITHGVPSNTFTITRLYDTPDSPYTRQTIIQKINSGVAIINHVGHGTPTSAMKLTICDIPSLTNTNKYPFLYSQACNSGQLNTQDECFAERWVNTEKAGGFATIMNTGKGYGSESDYDGPSNRYAREFFDALFSENISHLGKANQDSKEDNIWRIHESQKSMYHVYYTITLFGDPYVQIKGTTQSHQSPPNTPNKPSGPTVGQPNQSYTFTTSTIDPDNDTIKYLWDFGDTTTWTNWYPSNITCTISHNWTTAGTYHIRVKAKDSNMAESDWSPSLTITIGDNDIPSLTITKPEKALYIQDTRITKTRPYLFRNPFIIGAITITINATDPSSAISNVTFYINNNITKVDTTPPFTYLWNEKSFGKYTIKVIAYDLANNYNITETTVWKFL